VTGVCYRLAGRLNRTSRGYYVLYLRVRDAPEEVRRVLEALAGRDVDVAIICP
jgi:DNA-binding LacI/PurR family transcriptional regulator